MVKLKWNKPGDWIWSDQPAHEPLVEIEQFEAAQARIAARSSDGPRRPREKLTTTRPYLLRRLLFCGLCGRKMQGNYIHHSRTIYLLEDTIIPKCRRSRNWPNGRSLWPRGTRADSFVVHTASAASG